MTFPRQIRDRERFSSACSASQYQERTTRPIAGKRVGAPKPLRDRRVPVSCSSQGFGGQISAPRSCHKGLWRRNLGMGSRVRPFGGEEGHTRDDGTEGGRGHGHQALWTVIH